MKNILYIGALVALIAFGYVLWVTKEPMEENKPRQNGTPELATYFENRMINLGVADIGQPIEGFNANLLILAFPGLTIDDFVGVEAFEGHYEVTDGELAFVRDQEQSVSSAERTISSAGYQTLLSNVATRLEFPVMSEADVDTLVSMINTGEHIETRIDEGASALGVNVIPHEVLEDSRCPVDVTCVQAGTVRVRATLQSGLGTADQEFELNKPITTEAEIVTLVRVEPVAMEGKEIKESEYVLYFRIKKRQAGTGVD